MMPAQARDRTGKTGRAGREFLRGMLRSSSAAFGGSEFDHEGSYADVRAADIREPTGNGLDLNGYFLN